MHPIKVVYFWWYMAIKQLIIVWALSWPIHRLCIFGHMVRKVMLQIHCEPGFSAHLWSCGRAGQALFKTLYRCVRVCVCALIKNNGVSILTLTKYNISWNGIDWMGPFKDIYFLVHFPPRDTHSTNSLQCWIHPRWRFKQICWDEIFILKYINWLNLFKSNFRRKQRSFCLQEFICRQNNLIIQFPFAGKRWVEC